MKTDLVKAKGARLSRLGEILSAEKVLDRVWPARAPLQFLGF